MQTVNRLVDMLETSDTNVQTKVDRFSSSRGIEELGENPFVSVGHQWCYLLS